MNQKEIFGYLEVFKIKPSQNQRISTLSLSLINPLKKKSQLDTEILTIGCQKKDNLSIPSLKESYILHTGGPPANEVLISQCNEKYEIFPSVPRINLNSEGSYQIPNSTFQLVFITPHLKEKQHQLEELEKKLNKQEHEIHEEMKKLDGLSEEQIDFINENKSLDFNDFFKNLKLLEKLKSSNSSNEKGFKREKEWVQNKEEELLRKATIIKELSNKVKFLKPIIEYKKGLTSSSASIPNLSFTNFTSIPNSSSIIPSTPEELIPHNLTIHQNLSLSQNLLNSNDLRNNNNLDSLPEIQKQKQKKQLETEQKKQLEAEQKKEREKIRLEKQKQKEQEKIQKLQQRKKSKMEKELKKLEEKEKKKLENKQKNSQFSQEIELKKKKETRRRKKKVISKKENEKIVEKIVEKKVEESSQESSQEISQESEKILEEFSQEISQKLEKILEESSQEIETVKKKTKEKKKTKKRNKKEIKKVEEEIIWKCQCGEKVDRDELWISCDFCEKWYAISCPTCCKNISNLTKEAYDDVNNNESDWFCSTYCQKNKKSKKKLFKKTTKKDPKKSQKENQPILNQSPFNYQATASLRKTMNL